MPSIYLRVFTINKSNGILIQSSCNSGKLPITVKKLKCQWWGFSISEPNPIFKKNRRNELEEVPLKLYQVGFLKFQQNP
jgi:hypothetical protein